MRGFGAATKQPRAQVAAEAADAADFLTEPKQLLAVLQPLLHLDALGDVLQHRDAADGHAGVVALPDRGAEPHPKHFPVRGDMSYLGLPRAADLHRRHPLRLHGVAVVGVDDVAGAERQQQIGFATHDLAKTPIDPDEAAGRQVDFRYACGAGFEQRRQRRILLDARQCGGFALPGQGFSRACVAAQPTPQAHVDRPQVRRGRARPWQWGFST